MNMRDDWLEMALAQGGEADRAPSRRAALFLHAMQDEDRQWILNRLDPQQRDVLSRLIVDIRQLGLEVDLDQALELTDAPNSIDPAAASQVLKACPRDPDLVDPIQQINRASVKNVAAILQSEPAALIDAVMDAGPWAWQQSVSALLLQQRADWAPRAAHSAHTATALRSSVIVHLAQALAQHERERSPSRQLAFAKLGQLKQAWQAVWRPLELREAA